MTDKTIIIENNKNYYKNFINFNEDEQLCEYCAKLKYKIDKKVSNNEEHHISCNENVVALAYSLANITIKGQTTDMNKMKKEFSYLNCCIPNSSLYYSRFNECKNVFSNCYNNYLKEVGNSLEEKETCCTIC